MKRAVRKLRRHLWRSMVDCECPPLTTERCSPNIIRCHARMNRMYKEFARYGLATGPGSSEGDGLDPHASAAAVRRREQALEALKTSP